MFSPRNNVRPVIVAIIFAALTLVPAIAEELHDHFVTRWWQSEDGLPGNVVRSIAQGVEGYIWAATAEGIVRFDGVQFTGFTGEPDATLSRLPPRGLFPLADGSMWISTRGGLLRWDGQRLRAVIEEPDSSVPSNQISPVTQVMMDGSTIYVARGSKVSRWMGEARLEPAERTPEVEAKLQADLVAWGNRGRVTALSPLSRLIDRRGRIWKTNEYGGISVEETQTDSSAPPTVILGPGNVVTELMEDREGNIWAATGESGLVQIRERRVSVFSLADGLSDRAARALMEDHSGALWVGSKRGGADRIKGREVTRFEFAEGTGKRSVSALCEDWTGQMWGATANGSLFRLADGAFRIARNLDVPISKVSGIVSDPVRKELWFAGFHLLASQREGVVTRFDSNPPLATQEFSTLALGPDGVIWAGTVNGRLWRGVDGKFEEKQLPAVGGRMISSLLPDSDSGVWITTLGAGLFHLGKDRVMQFDSDAGLPDSRLTTVLDDETGHLWLGSLAGIFRVSRTALADFARMGGSVPTWLRLDRTDGLLSRECAGGFQPAGWRARDGTLYFPTIDGIARINPRSIALNRVVPPVVIEAVRAQGYGVPLGENALRFGPGRTRVEVRYTALSFSAPEKVRFRVRLLGLEDEWRDVGDRRTVQYEALLPGRYELRVQAANGDGMWNEAGAMLSFIVQPHFWETITFRVLLGIGGVAVAGAIGWTIARSRLKRRMARIELQRARENERARIAQDLHDDLGASLTEISMLASIASEEESSGTATTDALPEIAAKAHALVGALDEIVWAVNPRHDSVASLADYLSAFAADFLGHAGIDLRLDIPKELPEQPLDAERRHSLFLAIREALNNVVKHSQATEVRMQLRLEDAVLSLTVEDNGKGLAEAACGGEGLLNMKSRLHKLGGACVIEPIAPHGTRVQFTLPFHSITSLS